MARQKLTLTLTIEGDIRPGRDPLDECEAATDPRFAELIARSVAAGFDVAGASDEGDKIGVEFVSYEANGVVGDGHIDTYIGAEADEPQTVEELDEMKRPDGIEQAEICAECDEPECEDRVFSFEDLAGPMGPIAQGDGGRDGR